MTTEYAKPCSVCGFYYPGECYENGCHNHRCKCDGCVAWFNFEYEEDEEKWSQDE